MHKHLRRLTRVWIDNPIYFITSCTYKRAANLACKPVASALIAEWQRARRRHGWVIGRYVVMPDHVHFFCAPDLAAKPLSDFMGSWKEWTSKSIKQELALTDMVWQEEFFDHVMRSAESYSQKWNYVRSNPVRAGFVSNPDEWLWQGEIEQLQF
jgi:putative transposase